jgi:uncharacterized protein YbcI
MAKTKGEIEASICTALVQIQRNATGRGPRQSTASLEGRRLVIRMLGGLTAVEESLLRNSGGKEKCPEADIVRELRGALFRATCKHFEQVVAETTGVPVAKISHRLLCEAGEEEVVVDLADAPSVRHSSK